MIHLTMQSPTYKLLQDNVLMASLHQSFTRNNPLLIVQTKDKRYHRFYFENHSELGNQLLLTWLKYVQIKGQSIIKYELFPNPVFKTKFNRIILSSQGKPVLSTEGHCGLSDWKFEAVKFKGKRFRQSKDNSLIQDYLRATISTFDLDQLHREAKSDYAGISFFGNSLKVETDIYDFVLLSRNPMSEDNDYNVLNITYDGLSYQYAIISKEYHDETLRSKLTEFFEAYYGSLFEVSKLVFKVHQYYLRVIDEKYVLFDGLGPVAELSEGYSPTTHNLIRQAIKVFRPEISDSEKWTGFIVDLFYRLKD